MMQKRRIHSDSWRVQAILVLCILAFACLFGGGVYRVEVDSAKLETEGLKRYLGKDALYGGRGSLLDRNGRPVAASGLTYDAHINPRLFRAWERGEDEDDVAGMRALLAFEFGIQPQKLAAILERDSGFVYLQKRLAPQRIEQLRALRLPHVGYDEYWERYYPSAHETAHLVGYTSLGDDLRQVGKEGVEAMLEPALAPRDGYVRFLRTGKGRRVEILEEIQASDGADIGLTIDTRLQYFASAALANIVERHDADSASLILMDVRTGEILTMANVPTFNNNTREGPSASRRNRSVTDMFAPGSTMKPIVAALAIEQGLVNPSTMLSLSEPLRIGKKSFDDPKMPDDITVQEMIMRSSNEGVVRVVQMLEDKTMWEGLHSFGFGSGKMLGLKGEAGGVLHHYAKWKPIEKATLGYGYNISANLLQLARAYAALGNRGFLPQPHLVSGTGPYPQRPIISAGTARAAMAMLETVVASDKGTARRARIPGYRVAGKTGTVLRRKPEGKGYETDKYQSIFVGVAPASNPRFVSAVFVDNPKRDGYYGGLVAAPIFSRVMGHALRLYAVLPDQLLAAAAQEQ